MTETRVERLEIFPITIFKTRIEDNLELKHLLSSKIVLNSNYLKISSDWSTNNIKTSFESEPDDLELFYEGSPYLKMLNQRYTDCMQHIFDRRVPITAATEWIWFG